MKKLKDLSPADLAFCMTLAGLRRWFHRERGTATGMALGEMNNLNNEDIGLIAEYAFCKHYHKFFDGTFGGGDPGWDVFINGKRVDIKAIDKDHLNLVVNIYPEPKADMYLLIYVTGTENFILGWAARDDVANRNNITDLGHGDRYVVLQENLNKW